MSVKVHDSVTVKIGPGFTVEEVVTAFESRTVVLKNIPTQVTTKMILQALSPFGDVVDVQLPEDRPESRSMTVKATFTRYQDAASAAENLDRARLFGVNISAQLASHQSTSLGKGNVKDGDIYLEFPAPCKTGYAGYSSLPAAANAINLADGGVLRELIVSAAMYAGVPGIGKHNVKFYGLPADATAEELDILGPNDGVMFERPTYTDLKETLRGLQRRLEGFGDLIFITVIPPPFTKQTIRAWAHFTSPVVADAACRALNGRRQWFLNNERICARHVMSVLYKLPLRVFDALSDNIYRLRRHVSNATHRCDIVVHSKRISETTPATVKLVAESLPNLTKLKTSFEALLKGQVVYVDARYGGHVPVWDHFFAQPAGASFLSALEADHPGVIVQREVNRSLIRVFGSEIKLKPVRRAIRGKVAELRARQLHSFPVNGSVVAALFVHPDLLHLQRELGSENVYIDPKGTALKIRGNKDAVSVARLILHQIKHRPSAARKKRVGSCPVCFDDVSLPVTLDCGHTWCKHCLTGYLVAAADTKVFPINCLGDEARCGHPVSLKLAHSLLSAGQSM